ncbi:MAG: hypothetical protein JO257_05900 [Deltaproteobacteria bacterium]|nr:hypothetical protein [Deltaproteobacteria bacterium]
MKKLHDIDLMEHADGEADHGDLLRDPAARAKVEGLGELGELLRGHLELSADAVPSARFEQVWDAVDKGIAQPEKRRGVWHSIGAWFERYRGHVITGVVSAGAVAALALVLRGSPGSDGPIANHGTGSPTVTPVAYRPTEIESLDTPGGDSTVFNLDDEDGPATVIWVTPADTVEGI